MLQDFEGGRTYQSVGKKELKLNLEHTELAAVVENILGTERQEQKCGDKSHRTGWGGREVRPEEEQGRSYRALGEVRTA